MVQIDWKKDITIDKAIVEKMYNVLEKVYLLVLCVFYVEGVFETSMLHIEIPFDFYGGMKYVIGFTVFLKVLCSLERYKRIWYVLASMGVVATVMYYFGDFEIQLFAWMLVIGAVGVPYKKIMRVFFWSSVSVLGISMVASFTGMATHLIYFKNDNVRYSFGMTYTTEFCAYVLYTTLAGWMGYCKEKDLFMAFVFALEAVLLYMFCFAWCSSFVAALSAVAVVYLYVTNKEGHKTNAFDKMVWFFQKYAFVICGFIMVTLTALYSSDNPFMVKLNGWLTGRLQLGKDAFTQRGIHAFGKYFVLHGNAGIDYIQVKNYNFIDSAYCLILVRYGWVLMLVLIGMYLYTISKAKKNCKNIVVMTMALLAVHCMIEHHWIEVMYNPILLILFSRFDNEKNGREQIDLNDAKVSAGDTSKRGYIRYIVSGLYVAVLILFTDNIMSVIRTICSDYLGGLDYANDIFAVCVFVMLVGIYLVASGLSSSIFNKNRLIVGVVINLIIVCAFFVLIKQGYGRYKDGHEAGNSINQILDTAIKEDCTIYVDSVPEYYKKSGLKVKDKLVLGNGIYADDNCVMVVGSDREYHILLKKGFVFVLGSSDEALYTNNKAVIMKAEETGFEIIKSFEEEY